MTAAASLLIATTNRGKLEEMRLLLRHHSSLAHLRLRTPSEFPDLRPVEETGTTFAENATLKAVALAQATGLPALADDSGLCVDALEGAPGLHSARWAGPLASDQDRTAALLRVMAGVPEAERTARFVCAVACALPNGRSIGAEGVCEGTLLTGPRGTHGFGYDPVFLVVGLDKTLAEMTREEKNRISHRAHAIHALAPHLVRLLSDVYDKGKNL